MWLSVDPLAEQMPSWSSYNYTFSNPVIYTDPTGMAPETGEWPPSGWNPLRGIGDGIARAFKSASNNSVTRVISNRWNSFTSFFNSDRPANTKKGGVNLISSLLKLREPL